MHPKADAHMSLYVRTSPPAQEATDPSMRTLDDDARHCISLGRGVSQTRRARSMVADCHCAMPMQCAGRPPSAGLRNRLVGAEA